MESIPVLDVTQIEPRLKHSTIFQHFDDLSNGESFIIDNDHDPKPLQYQLLNMHGNTFTWEYLKQGPDHWQIKITRKEAEEKTKEESKPVSDIPVLNVTKIEPRLKHPTIFKCFDALKVGESFIIDNDHDPKPMYYQLLGTRGNIFSWEYLQQGPSRWHIKITKNSLGSTTPQNEPSEKDLKKAEVFAAKGEDYSCGSHPTNNPPSAKKAIPASQNMNNWPLDFLADYIKQTHHRYIKENTEIVNGLSEKVAEHHQAHHPELSRLAQSIPAFMQNMATHISKADTVAYPSIKQAIAIKNGATEKLEEGIIKESAIVLQKENAIITEDLAYLRRITNDFALPEDACNSYAYLYQRLEELEIDLKQYLYVENNILLPKAVALEAELA